MTSGCLEKGGGPLNGWLDLSFFRVLRWRAIERNLDGRRRVDEADAALEQPIKGGRIHEISLT